MVVEFPFMTPTPEPGTDNTPTSRMLAERAAQGLPPVPTVTAETAARLRRTIDTAHASKAAA